MHHWREWNTEIRDRSLKFGVDQKVRKSNRRRTDIQTSFPVSDRYDDFLLSPLANIQFFCPLCRYLCEQIVPGNRVTVVGIYCIRASGPTKVSQFAVRGTSYPRSKFCTWLQIPYFCFETKLINSFPTQSRSAAFERGNTAVRHPYVRVLGLSIDNEGPGRSALGSHCMITSSSSTAFTEAEEEELIALANSPGIYERLARSIAPSIYGSTDIKKAIACLMFGGSRKRSVLDYKLKCIFNYLNYGPCLHFRYQ